MVVVGVALLAEGAAAAGDPALEDSKDRRSYALGMALGNQLRSQSVDVDVGLYHQGLEDALSGGKTLLTEAEARETVQQLQLELKQRRRAPPPGDKVGLSAPPRTIQVSFKLDPRLTKSLYMGERWVAAATYSSVTASDPRAITLQARARGAGAARAESKPTWTASDPEMVTISPPQGDEVTLTVRRTGESTVTVRHGDASSTFAVKTLGQGTSWRVDVSAAIAQPSPAGATAAAMSVPDAGQQER
jgi:hypothetical protein